MSYKFMKFNTLKKLTTNFWKLNEKLIIDYHIERYITSIFFTHIIIWMDIVLLKKNSNVAFIEI